LHSFAGVPSTVLSEDKEIAVRIRSNSHYRISLSGQVGMLIVVRHVKDLLGRYGEIVEKGEALSIGMAGYRFSQALYMKSAFILSF
jgi:hypothetical protein